MGDNLLWVAHFDNRTQSLSAYDPSGTFSPEMALPPGTEVPDASEVGQLTELVSGRIYFFWVAQNQTADIDGYTREFYKGQAVWK